MDLTAGDAVAQSAIDLPEELLVDGPEDQREKLKSVDDEPRGDKHIAEDQVAQKLGLQQPNEVHDVWVLLLKNKYPQGNISRRKKDPGPRKVSATQTNAKC